MGFLVTRGVLGSLWTKNSEPPSVLPQLRLTRDLQPPPSTLEPHPPYFHPEALHWPTITGDASGLLATMGGLGSLVTKSLGPSSVAPQLHTTRGQHRLSHPQEAPSQAHGLHLHHLIFATRNLHMSCVLSKAPLQLSFATRDPHMSCVPSKALHQLIFASRDLHLSCVLSKALLQLSFATRGPHMSCVQSKAPHQLIFAIRDLYLNCVLSTALHHIIFVTKALYLPACFLLIGEDPTEQ